MPKEIDYTMLPTRQHRHVYSHYRPKNYHLSQSVREKQLTKDSQSKSESDGLSKMCFGQHAHVTLIIARPRCYRNLGSDRRTPWSSTNKIGSNYRSAHGLLCFHSNRRCFHSTQLSQWAEVFEVPV